MKTLAELLAGGTLPELAAAITANTKSAQALFVKKDATEQDLTEALRLDTETEQLETKRAELQKVEDAKDRTAKRFTEMNKVDRPPFPGGTGSDDNDDEATKNKRHIYSGSRYGSLKHITGSTRQEAETKAFRMGKFFLATIYGHRKSLEWCLENGVEIRTGNGVEIKAVNESINEQGGVLVPPEFSSTVITLIEKYGVFRANADIEPMASDSKWIPRRTGGVTTFWVGENQAITTDTTLAWDNIQLIAKKLGALVVVSNEILEDAIVNVADKIAFEIGYAFALAEDNAGFNGNGTSQYGGITGVTTKIAGLSGTAANIAGLFTMTGGSGWAGCTMKDLTNTMGLLPEYADGPDTAWYVHKTFYHSVMEGLMASAGGNTIRDLEGGASETRFLGYPVHFAQVLPRQFAASTICALFGDLGRAAALGERRVVTLFTDPYSLSKNDQIQIRGTERVDIVVHDVGNASATANLRVPGPIVALSSNTS